MNVMALLPFMIDHYESPNQLCVDSAEAIAQVRTSVYNYKHYINLQTIWYTFRLWTGCFFVNNIFLNILKETTGQIANIMNCFII